MFGVLGDSFASLQYLYRLGRTTIGQLVHETCNAIVTSLQHEFMKVRI